MQQLLNHLHQYKALRLATFTSLTMLGMALVGLVVDEYTLQERSLQLVTWGSGLLYLGIILFIFWRTSNGIPLFATIP